MEAQSGAGPGTHTIYYSRFVFPRTFRPPSELVLKPQIVAKSDTPSPVWTVAVLAGDTINKTDALFHEQLLSFLNLVQENVGTATVFTKHPATSELTQSRAVDWELLPEGIRQDLLLAKVLPKDLRKGSEFAQRFEERRHLLQSLQPKRWVVGSSGFRRYFGAQFQDDLVALENVEYGNALYVLKGPWEELSKLSRLELWGKSNNVSRVVHTPGWENRAIAMIGRLKCDGGQAQQFCE